MLIETGRYRDALSVRNSIEPDTKAMIGRVTNGSFEEDIDAKTPDHFNWRLPPGASPQVIRTDGDRSAGSYSLAFVFGNGTSDFRPIVQTVAVQPETEYIFTVRYRAEIETQAELKWMITDRGNDLLLASTDGFVPGNGWKTAEARFKVPRDVDGVEIAFKRTGCVGLQCNIRGILWMDDVAITIRKNEKWAN
jgi:hypothetical protein